MPKVNEVQNCKTSGLTCGKCGEVIPKGGPYVWWKFMRGGKYVRCKKPSCASRPADLTRSEFWSFVYEMHYLANHISESIIIDDLISERDDVVSQLEEQADELEGKLDNMPDGLRDGDTGQMLQERSDALREMASSLESVDTDLDDDLSDEDRRIRIEEVAGELQSIISDISCS